MPSSLSSSSSPSLSSGATSDHSRYKRYTSDDESRSRYGSKGKNASSAGADTAAGASGAVLTGERVVGVDSRAACDGRRCALASRTE